MSDEYDWSKEKDKTLRRDRGFGFAEIVAAIEAGQVLDDIPHPSDAYAHQRMFVVNLAGYAVLVPYVRNGDEVFLKTAFRSRKATRAYLRFN